MRYSQMSQAQRARLEQPESFPVRAHFLGKVGTLSFEEVRCLREKGVDFEVPYLEEERPATEFGILMTALSAVLVIARWFGAGREKK